MRQNPKTNFYKVQKQRNSPPTSLLFDADPGNGLYNGKRYPFVLASPERNLWGDIREDVIRYFNGCGLGTNRAKGLSSEQIVKLEADGAQCIFSTDIQFWHSGGTKSINGKELKLPTGHVLSSQVACINHLFPLIRDKNAATHFLHNINILVCEALPVDIHERGNFVEFEVVGGGSYLNEGRAGKPLRRGANCTSVDAVMKGRTRGGDIVLFLIEWKYVEQYRHAASKWDGKHGQVRQKRYCSFFTKDNTPFTFCNNNKDESFFRQLFTEPYYQLMRQTLLGSRMIQDPEINGRANSFEHVLVIPSCNYDLRMKSMPIDKTDAAKRTGDLAKNWNTLVKNPIAFFDPQQLFEPLMRMREHAKWLSYLRKRYWEPSFTASEIPSIRQYDCIRLLHDMDIINDGERHIVPKGTVGAAIEIWHNGEAYEFDSIISIPRDDGTLGAIFLSFPVKAEDVEIAHSLQTEQYYPPTR